MGLHGVDRRCLIGSASSDHQVLDFLAKFVSFDSSCSRSLAFSFVKVVYLSQGVATTPDPQEVVVSTLRYSFRKPFVCVGFSQPLVIQRV